MWSWQTATIDRFFRLEKIHRFNRLNRWMSIKSIDLIEPTLPFGIHLCRFVCLFKLLESKMMMMLMLQRLSVWRHVHRWRQCIPLRMCAGFHRVKLSTPRQPVRLESMPERRTLLQKVAEDVRLFLSAGIHGPAVWEFRGLVRDRWQPLSQRRDLCTARQSVRVYLSARLERTRLRRP